MLPVLYVCFWVQFVHCAEKGLVWCWSAGSVDRIWYGSIGDLIDLQQS